MEANHRIVIDTNVKAFGVLGIYISTLPALYPSEHMLITMHGRVIPEHTVSVSQGGGDGEGKVLEIDLESAWKELGLEAGWSNEVAVRIMINPLKEAKTGV
jgi:hypothetical protein